MKEVAKNPKTGVEYDISIPGFGVRWNSHGYCIITIDYWACEDKRDPEWAEAEKQKYPDFRSWQREMGRDWTMASGESFYPEFQFRQDLIVKEVSHLIPDKPIIRGWDFGAVNPACMWMQQANSGRVAFLRETMPKNMNIHEFRDLVRYLSGQVDKAFLMEQGRERTLKEIARIEAGNERPYNKYPEPPWFEDGQKFIDYSGHEAVIQQSIHSSVKGEKKQRNDYEVLHAGGILLEAIYTGVSKREHAFRYLMGNMPDGYPGLVVDPACALMIEGLGGGIAFKKPTPMDPEPSTVAKDGFYQHLHDAAGYPLAQIVILSDRAAQPTSKVWRGRSLVEDDGMESLGWSTDPSRYSRFV